MVIVRVSSQQVAAKGHLESCVIAVSLIRGAKRVRIARFDTFFCLRAVRIKARTPQAGTMAEFE
jgi:hypothetical protein